MCYTFELEKNAWVCVRPSGTEPKLNFIWGYVRIQRIKQMKVRSIRRSCKKDGTRSTKLKIIYGIGEK